MKVSFLETKYFQKIDWKGMAVQTWGKNGQVRVLKRYAKVQEFIREFTRATNIPLRGQAKNSRHND